MYILSTLLKVIRLTVFQILAAGSLPALIFGAPVPSLLSRDVAVADVRSLQTRSSSAYTLFGGDGTTSAGWPSINDWVATYDEMFEANKATMSDSCAVKGFENNSDEEINDINNSIKSVSASSGVDARFILAVVMQESTGCVRVGGTNNGVSNPGLMQSHNGKGTCNTGTPLSPCPSSEITQMIEDGTTGTADGPGLAQLLEQAVSTYKATDATKYYIAARMYNSGSLASDGNLGQPVGATACYASDIANRLLGWSTGTSSCSQAKVEFLTHSDPFVPGNDGSASSTTTTTPVASATAPAISVTVSLDPTTTATPTATPPDTTSVAPPTTTTTTPPPAATSAATSGTSATSASATTTLLGPVYPGAVSTCQQWTLVVSGDYCLEVENDVGISASQFMDWNPGLDAACSNLWLGYEYCVKA